MAHEIAEYIPNTKIKYVDMPFEDLRNYRGDSSKFSQYGWKPKYSLKDGVKEVYNIIIEERIKNTDDMIYSNAKYIKEIEGSR